MTLDNSIIAFTLVFFLKFQVITKVHGIIGGNFATIYGFPYHVAVDYHKEYICGGTIISAKHVLTAGQCVMIYHHPSDYSVTAGRVNKHQPTNSIAVAHIRFKNFNLPHRHDAIPPFPDNDIAILTLYTPFTLHSRVNLISVDMHHLTPHKTDPMSVAGWGVSTVSNKKFSLRLKFIRRYLSRDSDCENIKRQIHNLNSNHMCIDHREILHDLNVGANYGDTGGGLIYNGVVIGVLSKWSTAYSTDPEIYTKIHPYSQFIKEIVYRETYNTKMCPKWIKECVDDLKNRNDETHHNQHHHDTNQPSTSQEHHDQNTNHKSSDPHHDDSNHPSTSQEHHIPSSDKSHNQHHDPPIQPDHSHVPSSSHSHNQPHPKPRSG